jgi:hypothetical protein
MWRGYPMSFESPEFPSRLGWYVLATAHESPLVCMFMPSDGPDRGEVLCGGHRYPALDARLEHAVFLGPFGSRSDAEHEADALPRGTLSLDAARATA